MASGDMNQGREAPDFVSPDEQQPRRTGVWVRGQARFADEHRPGGGATRMASACNGTQHAPPNTSRLRPSSLGRSSFVIHLRDVKVDVEAGEAGPSEGQRRLFEEIVTRFEELRSCAEPAVIAKRAEQVADTVEEMSCDELRAHIQLDGISLPEDSAAPGTFCFCYSFDNDELSLFSHFAEFKQWEFDYVLVVD